MPGERIAANSRNSLSEALETEQKSPHFFVIRPIQPIFHTMRFDKLTTKFQQALADAQSLALGHDNGFIEPQHQLAALHAQEDGGTSSLRARAGGNVAPL